MTRRTPIGAAIAMERTPARRLPRLRARAWTALAGREGPSRLPHALAWRLREQVYATPERVRTFAAAPRPRAAREILMVGNDLSRSGAPLLLVEIARLLLAGGSGVTVVSPLDGPLRDVLIEAGADVIVDPAVRSGDAPLLRALGAHADAAICNTVIAAHAVAALAPAMPVIWYIHEVLLLEELLAADPALAGTVAAAARVWAGSELPARVLRPLRPDVAIMPYGLDPIAGVGRPVAAARPLRLAVLASLEPRKGQDLLLDALALLSPAEAAAVEVDCYGRALFPDFEAQVQAKAAAFPNVRLHPALDEASYRAAMLGCDALVIPSRDDTLPLVSLDALGAGRVLICTRTTGTAAWLDPGRNGFVAAAPTAEAIAAALREAIGRADEWPAIAAAGRALFDAAFSRTAFAAAIERELAALGVPAA